MTADWIAVDWGTSRLRAWIVTGDGSVRAERRSDAGMGGLAPHAFEAALADLVGPGTTPVLACGMVGAREGWAEAPYLPVPCAPPGFAQGLKVGRVTILPGLKQVAPADVMRGEETQIAGLLSVAPQFDGVVCLPGTHTKWAHVSAGEVVSFRTAMTGEMFALLSQRSVLRHAVTAEWDGQAFAAAVSETLSRPEGLAAALFNIRARTMVGAADNEARARLSGLLIGAELAAMRAYWLGRHVAVVGEGVLCAHYREALLAQGVRADVHSGEDMVLAGLRAAYEQGNTACET